MHTCQTLVYVQRLFTSHTLSEYTSFKEYAVVFSNQCDRFWHIRHLKYAYVKELFWRHPHDEYVWQSLPFRTSLIFHSKWTNFIAHSWMLKMSLTKQRKHSARVCNEMSHNFIEFIFTKFNNLNLHPQAGVLALIMIISFQELYPSSKLTNALFSFRMSIP